MQIHEICFWFLPFIKFLSNFFKSIFFGSFKCFMVPNQKMYWTLTRVRQLSRFLHHLTACSLLRSRISKEPVCLFRRSFKIKVDLVQLKHCLRLLLRFGNFVARFSSEATYQRAGSKHFFNKRVFSLQKLGALRFSKPKKKKWKIDFLSRVRRKKRHKGNWPHAASSTLGFCKKGRKKKAGVNDL